MEGSVCIMGCCLSPRCAQCDSYKNDRATHTDHTGVPKVAQGAREFGRKLCGGQVLHRLVYKLVELQVYTVTCVTAYTYGPKHRRDLLWYTVEHSGCVGGAVGGWRLLRGGLICDLVFHR